ncbi:unnamed protein product, partial [Polarella glacialis]
QAWPGSPGQGDRLLSLMHVSNNWIAAKGLVDFLLEFIQFLGCCAIGRPMAYVEPGNLFDLVRCGVPLSLFWFSGHRVVHILVIFFYWARLLDVFTSAENIASALLPIKQLARGLVPACVVTLVGFCAFTHAFYAARDDDTALLWPDTFHHSFNILITAALPEDPHNMPMLDLVLTYLAVLFFSVFFLNIFIGVITELYLLEKERVGLTFQHVRASSCLTFLLRARVLPCGVLSTQVALAVSVITALCALGLQCYCLRLEESIPFEGTAFVVLQTIMFLSAYQHPDQPWAVTNNMWHKGGGKHYLWFCKPREPEEKPDLPSKDDIRWVIHQELREALEEFFPLESDTKGDSQNTGAGKPPMMPNLRPELFGRALRTVRVPKDK